MGSKDGGGRRINRKINIILILVMIFTIALPTITLADSGDYPSGLLRGRTYSDVLYIENPSAITDGDLSTSCTFKGGGYIEYDLNSNTIMVDGYFVKCGSLDKIKITFYDKSHNRISQFFPSSSGSHVYITPVLVRYVSLQHYAQSFLNIPLNEFEIYGNDTLSAPTGLSVEGTGGSGILTWNNVANANSYNIYDGENLIGSSTTNSYSFSGLPSGTHNLSVTTVNEVGESDKSVPVSYIVVLSVPYGLQASNITSNSLDLSWLASDGATSYILFQDDTQIATTTDNTYHVTNLNPSTTYNFQIVAVNDNGQSPLSDAVNATTLGVPPILPTGLSAENITSTSFTLYWFKQPDATSYNVYMNDELVGNVSQPLILNPSIDIENLTEGYTYSMTVAAVNEWGESVASLPLLVTTTVRNPVLKATVDNNKINLTWTGIGSSFDILLDNEVVAQATESPYTLAKDPGTYKVQIIQNYNENQYPSNIVTVKISVLQTVGSAQMSGDIVKNVGLVIAPAGGLLALALALKGSPILIAAAKAFFLKS